jgi:hypothetical protein
MSRQLVIPEPGKTSVYALGARNSDIRRALEGCLSEAVRQTKNIARSFRSVDEYSTCGAIYSYVSSHVRYVEDGEYQDIRLPRRLFASGQGDCKSIALFIAGCLKNLKIPFHFLYASYNRNVRIPGHVYIVTDSGIIIDPVAGKFNYEAPAVYKWRKKV